MFIYVCARVYVDGDLCDDSLYVCVSVCVRKKVYSDLFWIKPPEGDKDTSGARVWRLD